jgi:hypothetical protein
MLVINADDYPTIQDAIDDAEDNGAVEILFSAQVYEVSTELVLHSGADHPVKLRGVPHNYNGSGGTIIRATAGMRSVLAVLGQYCAIDSIRFDANRQATYGLFLRNATLLRCNWVMVEKALVDGVHCDVQEANNLNDGMRWESCIFTNNGTNYRTSGIAGDYAYGYRTTVAGTAATTASSTTVTFTSAPDLTTLGIRKGDYLRVGDTLATAFYGLIDTVSSSSITLQPAASNLPTLTVSGKNYAIGVGDGWHEERHADNNVNVFIGCLFRGSGGSGFRMNGLHGDTILGGQFDFNNFGGCSFGPADNVGAVLGATVAHTFAEGNTFTFGFTTVWDASILSPTSGDPIFSVGAMAKGAIVKDGVCESIELGAPQNFVLQVRNNANNIEHRIVADAVQGWATVQASKITGASYTYADTPDVSSGTGFTSGAGVVSGLTHILALDTAGSQNVAISGTATIEDDTTGATHHVMLSTDSRNIGGTTRNRTVLYLRDLSGNYLNWTTSTIASGKHIAIRVQAYVR